MILLFSKLTRILIYENQKFKPLSNRFNVGVSAPLCFQVYAGFDDNHHHASPPPPLAGVDKYKYKVGDSGPGGGFIFFVDYYDQYPGFTYLEAAPTDIEPVLWCDLTISIPSVEGWSAKGVGKGQANTDAMIAAGCTSGAANSADQYVTGTKSDWFLPSLGEAKLMYDNLLEAGVGGFASFYYWSSTENGSGYAWYQDFWFGYQANYSKGTALPVRAVRAF